MSEQDWLTKDFYQELGVDKTADDAAIKKAYRKLARKYHPDHNPGDSAAESRFKNISEAYTVLSDKQQRQKYDAIRQMAGGGARFTSGGGAGFEDLFGGMFGGRGGSTQFDAADLGGLFGGLFGGGRASSSFGGAQFGGAQFGGNPYGSPVGGSQFTTPPPPQTPTKGGDLKSAVTLTFRQALKGTEIRLKVGGKPVNARIPAGVKDGQKIKLAGKGKPGAHGGKSGDLIITVTVTPHPLVRRIGNDLHIPVPITLAEAINGTTVDVPMFDGTSVSVAIPAGVTSGDTVTVTGRGVATAKNTGDLVVEVRLALPAQMSDAAREAVQAFTAATADFDPRITLASEIQNS